MSTLQPGQFTFNSIESSTLGDGRIQLRPEIHAPKRKASLISVPGVDGDYILDEEAYENTDLTLEIIYRSASEALAREVRETITETFDTGGYVPLVLYFDPDRVYYAKTVNGPNFRLSGQWPDTVLYSIEFSLKPFKFYKTKFDVTLPLTGNIKTTTLTNTSKYPAKPKITLTGTGDSTLTINSKTYSFKNVDDYIIIDSEVEEAYKLDGTTVLGRNNKMCTREFPLLLTGDNVITYIGATEIKIEGRWTTLVG